MPVSQRSFAVSLQWVVIRFSGTIPGPIIIGTLIDQSCLFWKRDCADSSKACYLYKNNSLSSSFLAFSIISKLITIVGFALAMLVYRTKQTDGEGEEEVPLPIAAAAED